MGGWVGKGQMGRERSKRKQTPHSDLHGRSRLQTRNLGAHHWLFGGCSGTSKCSNFGLRARWRLMAMFVDSNHEALAIRTVI